MCTKGQSANLKCSSRDAMPPFYASPRALFVLFVVVFCARSLKDLRAGSELGGETVRSVCLLSERKRESRNAPGGLPQLPPREVERLCLVYQAGVSDVCVGAIGSDGTRLSLLSSKHVFMHIRSTSSLLDTIAGFHSCCALRFRSATCPRRRLVRRWS